MSFFYCILYVFHQLLFSCVSLLFWELLHFCLSSQTHSKENWTRHFTLSRPKCILKSCVVLWFRCLSVCEDTCCFRLFLSAIVTFISAKCYCNLSNKTSKRLGLVEASQMSMVDTKLTKLQLLNVSVCSRPWGCYRWVPTLRMRIGFSKKLLRTG